LEIDVVVVQETRARRAPPAYRTENSRDLIRSPEEADAFAEWLEQRNKIEAKRRRKLGMEDAA
jgi:hypothetical protein